MDARNFEPTLGVRFNRNADGSVAVSIGDATYTMPANVWASAVASVSVAGETSDRWLRALEFHSKPPQRGPVHFGIGAATDLSNLCDLAKTDSRTGNSLEVSCCHCLAILAANLLANSITARALTPDWVAVCRPDEMEQEGLLLMARRRELISQSPTLEEWLGSPEGQQALIDAGERSAAAAKKYLADSRPDWRALNRPIGGDR